jgi:hypothetical protein
MARALRADFASTSGLFRLLLRQQGQAIAAGDGRWRSLPNPLATQILEGRVKVACLRTETARRKSRPASCDPRGLRGKDGLQFAAKSAYVVCR